MENKVMEGQKREKNTPVELDEDLLDTVSGGASASEHDDANNNRSSEYFVMSSPMLR